MSLDAVIDVLHGSVADAARAARGAASDTLADAGRLARFLRGRVEFVVRPDDIFISSYPRSGTTWMQHIAHVLRSGGDTSFQHISDVAPWFERSLALGQRRADAFAAMPSPRIFKSHLPRAWLPRGARYIYVQRDGRDVAVSYFHFYRSHLGYAGTFSEFFELFLRGELQYGSWFKHVAGWQAHAAAPDQLLLHYEQLQHDLLAEMTRIAEFCRLRLDASALARLRPLCDFRYMREHESKFDHASGEPGLRARQQGSFIRRGVSGDYRQAFSPEQCQRFAEQLMRPIRSPTRELHLAAFLL